MFRNFKIIATLLLLSGAVTRSATAQNKYAPQRPAISPWMGLWQNNTGALDNYHTFVLPRVELNRTLQLQNAAISRQEQGLQTLNYEFMQPQGASSGMQVTGQGSTYMNYSHYFGGTRQAARPVAARAPASAASSPSIPGMSH